jgi:hypothetical protein
MRRRPVKSSRRDICTGSLLGIDCGVRHDVHNDRPDFRFTAQAYAWPGEHRDSFNDALHGSSKASMTVCACVELRRQGLVIDVATSLKTSAGDS